MKQWATLLLLSSSLLASPSFAQTKRADGVTKTQAHYDRARTGWNNQERQLTRDAVAKGGFGLLWSSPQFDSVGDAPPRLFSTPLYLPSVRLTGGEHRGKTLPVAFMSTTAGYAYAVSTGGARGVQPGTILWRTKLTESPCNKGMMGNYGTGLIDPKSNRYYVTYCSNTTTDNSKNMWGVLALDLRSGQLLPGWPLDISQAMVDQPQLNRNGTRVWKIGPGMRYVQRGALNISEDGQRLYVAFGADSVAWMTVVDTKTAKVASAFSVTPNDQENGGGIWAQSGPAVDEQGRIYVTTGSNLQDGIKLGLEAMHPNTEHNWSHSILQFEDDRANGLKLTGTYTPYNYCQAGKADIDIGSSGVVSFDLPSGTSATTHLLTLGGGKQGNIYLLDRDKMPGSLTKRPECTLDSEEDQSLLAPEPQPEWKRRGPISLFKPFSDEIGAYDQAKSRTTASIFRDEAGTTFIYVSGASKKGENYNTSAPPGLAKVRVVAAAGQPAHLKLDKLETTLTFHNAGSPIVSSNGARDAIVWMVDQNAARTANLWGANPPQPILYAFSADTLDVLWKSEPGQLFTTGNYGEPTVVDGLVLVGTDRLQAFGLKR